MSVPEKENQVSETKVSGTKVSETKVSETKVSLKSLQSFVNFTKQIGIQIATFFQDRKNNSNVMLLFAIISILVSVYFLYQVVNNL